MTDLLGLRPVLPGDLEFAIRAILLIHDSARANAVQRLIQQACDAEQHRQRTGRAHPRFGTGSLMSAASTWPLAPLPGHCDRAYLAALQRVTHGLLTFTPDPLFISR